MKYLYRIIADIIFLAHFLVLVIALFGWLVPSLWYVYMTVLILTLLSDLAFGYCILSKWEFDLRKKINPELDYRYSWTTFYTYKYTQNIISERFIERAAQVFIIGSLIFNIYFHYFFR